MTNHLDGSWTLEKSPDLSRIFFSMPIEALSRFWNSVESLSNLWNFPEWINIAYDIIVLSWLIQNFLKGYI